MDITENEYEAAAAKLDFIAKAKNDLEAHLKRQLQEYGNKFYKFPDDKRVEAQGYINDIADDAFKCVDERLSDMFHDEVQEVRQTSPQEWDEFLARLAPKQTNEAYRATEHLCKLLESRA